jgi:hypothetical protein
MKPAEAIAEKAGARKSSGQDEPGRASKTTFAVGTPEYVVAQYVKAASWQERLQYVKQTEGIREKMPQWYGNKRLGFECDEIESRESTGAGVGSIVTVDAVTSGPNAFGTIVKGNQRYYLEKTPQGYVILWEPSVGWLPLAWSAYTASRPEQPMTFPLNCELSDSYSGTMEKKINRTHYSLRVTPPGESGSSTAFVVRESPAGRIIFDTLRTGESISVGDYEGLW